MPETEKIGIIGGTFDPIHYGHLNIAQEMGKSFALQQIIFIPAPSPPHKNAEGISAFRHRYAMVKLGINNEENFCVSDLEVQHPGKSYTVDTLRRLHALHPHAAFYFLMGMDSFAELGSWKEYHKLFNLCNIVVAQRPGVPAYTQREDLPVALHNLFCYDAARDTFFYKDLDIETEAALKNHGRLHFLRETWMDVSSTKIRHRVHDHQNLDGLVPEVVQKYIVKHGLYQDLTTSG